MPQCASLTDLFNLTVAYSGAFSRKLAPNSALCKKFEDSLTPDDHKTGRALQFAMLDLWTSKDDDVYIYDRVDSVSDELAVATIRLHEFISRAALKALGEDELQALVPMQDRSTAVSKAYAANDAPTLAKLFAPKPF